jgi:hypothetical protein
LKKTKVIAVISLLDLYGPTFYPSSVTGVKQRYAWGKQYLEEKVGHERFLQFFAVHETEVWLLSDPSIFPGSVRTAIEATSQSPESINNT